MTGNLLLPSPTGEAAGSAWTGFYPAPTRAAPPAGRARARRRPRAAVHRPAALRPRVAARRRRARPLPRRAARGRAARARSSPPELIGRIAEGRTAPLKSFLLDQKGIAGIGNIYADEALHRAELHPLSPAGSMRAEHWEALHEGIVEALEAGLANGGASIDDYRDARGERGSMQDEFLVHTREGEDCPRCGERISRIVVSGRSTYFCPACQVRLRRRRTRRRRRGAAMSERRSRRRGLRGRPLDRPRGARPAARWSCRRPGRRGGVDVRGGGPGTRETEIIGPLANPQEATAVLLTGGSAYGLAAADGVVRWLRGAGRGYATPGGLVPLVPAAVIYDLRRRRRRRRGPGPSRATPPARRPRGRPRARAASAPARAPRSARLRGRERASPGGVGYAATRTGSGRDRRRARGRQRDRRRDRRRRARCSPARAATTARCCAAPS